MKSDIEYYSNNDLSIIPLNYKTKEPSTCWSEFQHRTASAEECERWFSTDTDRNVGIVTGAISNIVVLDVDGEQGERSLLSLGVMPATPTVRTGRGRHLYFRHPGFPVRNSVAIKPGLDVRGDGGYVVAPSLRPTVCGNACVPI
jgi:hypothetical protein